MSRLRVLTILLALFATVVTLAACGGSGSSDTTGGGDTAPSSENPQKVLDQAFDPAAAIKSADIDLKVDFSSSGAQSTDLTATLSGPVDGSSGDVPKFDLTAGVNGSGGGQDLTFDGGATSTGDSFFVTYGGNAYEVDASTASYIKQAFQQGSQQSNQQSGSLRAFKDVLTNVTNEGTEDVKGTESVHVSGDVDVKKLVDAIRPLAEQAQSLGSVAPGTSVPTPAELDQVTKLIKSATFDVYAGKDDHILRRLTATIDLDDPQSNDTAKIGFDITLGKVNEPQDISAPDGAKPLSDLVGPGGLGGLLGAGGLGGGSAGGSSGSSGLSDAQAQCLQNAQTPTELQSCLSQ